MPRNATAQIDADTGMLTRARDRRFFDDNFSQKPLVLAGYTIGDTSSDVSPGIEAALEANKQWYNPAANGVDAKVTYSASGGVTLTTNGGSSDQQAIMPSAAPEVQGGMTALDLDTNRQPAVEWGFATSSDITTAQTIWAGLVLTQEVSYTVDFDADQIKLEYVAGANSGVFMIRHSIGGTDASIDTGITVAASTEYFVKIKLYADRTFGIHVGEAADPGAAKYFHVDSAMTDLLTLKPTIGIQESGTAVAVTARYVAGGVNLWE